NATRPVRAMLPVVVSTNHGSAIESTRFADSDAALAESRPISAPGARRTVSWCPSPAGPANRCMVIALTPSRSRSAGGRRRVRRGVDRAPERVRPDPGERLQQRGARPAGIREQLGVRQHGVGVRRLPPPLAAHAAAGDLADEAVLGEPAEVVAGRPGVLAEAP